MNSEQVEFLSALLRGRADSYPCLKERRMSVCRSESYCAIEDHLHTSYSTRSV